MDSVADLLRRAKEAGLHIASTGGNLKVTGISGDDKLFQEIARRKVEVLCALAGDLPADVDNDTCDESSSNEFRYRPFPVDHLPGGLRRFVVDAARALGCDVAFLAVPMLAVLAAAIGSARSLRIKGSWHAPSILWTAVVSESGSLKSPALRLTLSPLRELQDVASREYELLRTDFLNEMARFDRDQAIWKRNKSDDEPPTKPLPPISRRMLVSDTTIEALLPILRDNPRGVLLARDELSGWLASFDRYSAGKGGDESVYLTLYNGDPIFNDRKTGEPKTIYVPEPRVSITGTIQPEILTKAMGPQQRQSGLCARILFACPPRRRKVWSDDEVCPTVVAKYAEIVRRLHGLAPSVDEQGQPSADVIELTDDAKSLWIEYFNRHAAEQRDMAGDLLAAWSKLEEAAARIALVIHCTRIAARERSVDPVFLDVESMSAGIAIAEWFKHEARRIYGRMCESDDDRDRRRLVEFIRGKDGIVTARDVQRGCKWIGTAQDVDRALSELAKLKLGGWVNVPAGPKGGAPTRRFQLFDASTDDTTAEKPDDFEGCVAVESVTDDNGTVAEEWGTA